MAVFSCGALPVVLVLVLFVFSFFLSCNIEAGAPGRHERALSRRSEGGGTVHDCFFAVRFLPCSSFCFVFFFILQHRRRATRTEV